MKYPVRGVLLASLGVAVSLSASALELLTGTVPAAADQQPIAFNLSGPSRDDIIGGEIRFGERVFTIDQQSRMGLIGARRALEQGSEFVVFSSSFSTQTATGQPRIAGQQYVNCEQPYNSYLAIYRVTDPAAVTALGETPYPQLLKDAGQSGDATVYCFYSKPPA